ncbi:MAG: hypothetical protein JXA46_04360 [Dehalococcoidales bacterium]|nr:hypothetical protein [Dehalococcoidales bacterium]
MKQNIYDNPDFFKGYCDLRTRQAGLNEVLEQPAVFSILPYSIQLVSAWK